MYFSVLKSLEPLKKLRKQVAEVAEVANGGKADFENYQEDEVGKIALEFQKAFKKNQELIQSRQLFYAPSCMSLKRLLEKVGLYLKCCKKKSRKKD